MNSKINLVLCFNPTQCVLLYLHTCTKANVVLIRTADKDDYVLNTALTSTSLTIG